MEHHISEHMPRATRSTPKDFFLCLGSVIALYGTIISFLTLIFYYIDVAFPDPLSYQDPYSTGARVAMATMVVLVPTMLGLLLTIRRDIVREPGKANIWVRRWALVLTIFLSAAVAVVDLITLLYSFFGGDLTTRFTLKALIVLLLAILTTLHFFADYRGYWTLHRRKVNMVGAAIGALAFMTVASGFILIGSPAHQRALRLDQQKINDLTSIQYQITDYWQTKRMLPEYLTDLDNPLQGFKVPQSPDGSEYEYATSSPLSFSLCTTFSLPSPEYHEPSNVPEAYEMDQTFGHAAGPQCFNRTIDPDRYPSLSK